MVLRALETRDAPFMLEWMHDPNVTEFLEKDFSSMTIDNCITFIKSSASQIGNQRHFAIVDCNDEYMGTISLKNIDFEHKHAEYAISCRTKSMGTGIAKQASEELFEISKNELGLSLIYLYLSNTNIRAEKFYNKVGFTKSEIPDFLDKDDFKSNYIWYEIHL